ncbi:MAG: YbaK/EbsC family protein [Fastidiosipilaceae bacterium]|jgi:prolyl-tRNA editing enzyme YbaK/EbsC (Cys-tRNA(Pro) deacylase)|nr:YbaK/EbsC family protein [Clostridiaceae bacterium]
MSFESVRTFFRNCGLEDRLKIFDESSATVELAAVALGCEPQQIAKTLSFLIGDQAILVVCAGNVKIDNSKYKTQFQTKAKMIPADQVKTKIGHPVGGVCPFAVNPEVKIYLDQSLKENDIVYPAAGTGNSAVELSIPELEKCLPTAKWIDVCKPI